MLYSERKRLAALAEREAAGESVWGRDLPPAAREKLINVLGEFFPHDFNNMDDWDYIHFAVCDARGVRNLRNISARYDDTQAALRASALDAVADVLESAYAVAKQRLSDRDASEFQAKVNVILASYRITLELVAGQVVEFESRELHQELVVPALLLFGGDPRFVGAERAYQDALREVATDAGAANSITDAGTCLQEVLVALGCKGNALGSLLKDARSKGLLGAGDSKFTSAIADLIDWVSSDRSGNGDAHNARPAQREDAWLTIHVVGALALRLAADTPRPGA